jgi:succinate dehydrogenase / fumarate reductase cytochrome b subunit
MSLFNPTLRSSIGLKALAAVSGLFMTGWLVLHLLGNLTAFSGTADMDGYAAALRRLGPLLWLVRGGLLVAFLVHVGATVTLAKRARMARPVRAEAGFHASSVASRAMAVGGPMLLVFVVYHLLHLTFGVVHPTFVPGHVYANLVSGVRPLAVFLLYLTGAGLAGLHLSHGLWSAGATLGSTRATGRAARRAGRVLGVLAALGFASVPAAIFLGVVR